MRISCCLIIMFCFNTLFAQNNVFIKRGERPAINIESIPPDAYEAGEISIKINNLYAHNISVEANSKIITDITRLTGLNNYYGLVNAHPLFKEINAREDQKILHEAWGFNRWYVLQLNKNADVKEMVKAYMQTGLFEVVEPVYKNHLLKADDKVDFVPNDPSLNYQWNFLNTGQAGGTPGADIHLTKAWDIETGDTDIKVSVHDKGIQLNHPDLQQNIAYGKSFNFINYTTIIDPCDHGTHVAGTIAEVNNNGIGGSGIAGGNGSINSGVRLISCEIFDDNGNTGDIASSYIYAADNGACISNNSWAYTVEGVYDLSVLDAIDYFIQNAGGKVMQGGLVIFAAGNNGAPLRLYPSIYSPVVCVAATNNIDKKTFYSNYGNWVSISAPGGEFNGYTDIYSCKSYSDYMFDHGTSMACPHVTGVAALVASYLKGKTSASDVREIVLSTADNIDSLNPEFIGRIGTGRVNAYKALLKAKAIADNKNVQPATTLIATADCNYSFAVKWNNNITNNGVILAYSNGRGIGCLTDGKNYNIGDSIAGGGVVIYKGNARSYLYNASVNDMFHYFKVWSIGSNNQYSLGTSYDTVLQSTCAVSGYNAIQQNFNYPPLFPTLEWRTVNPDNDLTWTHSVEVDTAAMGAGDQYSMAMYNYSYNYTPGAVDWLTAPILLLNNPDSIGLSFWHSYRYRNTNNATKDSLAVMVSTDCGNTYTSVWNKGGKDLATVAGIINAEWKPQSIADWKQDFIDLSSFKSNNKLMVAFRSVNGLGNNIFLDNINVAAVYKNDAAIASILQPAINNCKQNISPVINLYNNGNSSIQSAQISYSIDGGNNITTNWSRALQKGDSVLINLSKTNVSAGNHNIKIFVSSVNQTADDFHANDTMLASFIVSSTASLPLQESFEGSVFPPVGWQLQQASYDSIYWQRNTLTASNGNASVVMPNLMLFDIYGRTEDLLSPSIALHNVDSVFLIFDLSYDTTRLVTNPLVYDTLQVDISSDCGNNWQSVYKKWGSALQTNNIPMAKIHEYVPTGISQWRTDSLNLTGLLQVGDTFRIRFRNIENNGNDLYLDNIRVYTKVNSVFLNQNGYIIYPDPFVDNIIVRHLIAPTKLQAIALFDIQGKKVLEKDYNTNASTTETIHTTNLANGIYVIKLFYIDKTITEKIIKVNR